MPRQIAQAAFRWRTDSNAANAGTPVWAASENVNYNPTPGAAVRVRFRLDNTGTTSLLADAWALFVSKDGGAQSMVTASSAGVRSIDATAGASADDSTIATANFRLSAPPSGKEPGAYDFTGTIAALALDRNFSAELEFGVEFDDTSYGHSYQFYAHYAGGLIDSYAVVPLVSIPSRALTPAGLTPTSPVIAAGVFLDYWAVPNLVVGSPTFSHPGSIPPAATGYLKRPDNVSKLTLAQGGSLQVFNTPGDLRAIIAAAGSPVFSLPALGQSQRPVASNLAAGSPEFGATEVTTPLVTLPVISLAVGSPQIGAGAFVYGVHLPSANALTVAAPSLGVGNWDLGFLTALLFATHSPVLGTPAVVSLNFLLPHGITIGSLQIGRPILGLPIWPSNLVGASPTFTRPDLKKALFARDLISPPADLGVELMTQIVIPKARLTHGDIIDEDTDEPIQQAIFSNYNDNIDIDLDSGTLIGRTAEGRGPAQPIQVRPPLLFAGQWLVLDIKELLSDTNFGIGLLNQQVQELQRRYDGEVTYLRNKVSDLQDQINADAVMIGYILNTTFLGWPTDVRQLYARGIMVGSPELGLPGYEPYIPPLAPPPPPPPPPAPLPSFDLIGYLRLQDPTSTRHLLLNDGVYRLGLIGTNLTARSLAVSSPLIGSELIRRTLSANSITGARPVLGAPDLTRIRH